MLRSRLARYRHKTNVNSHYIPSMLWPNNMRHSGNNSSAPRLLNRNLILKRYSSLSTLWCQRLRVLLKKTIGRQGTFICSEQIGSPKLYIRSTNGQTPPIKLRSPIREFFPVHPPSAYNGSWLSWNLTMPTKARLNKMESNFFKPPPELNRQNRSPCRAPLPWKLFGGIESLGLEANTQQQIWCQNGIKSCKSGMEASESLCRNIQIFFLARARSADLKTCDSAKMMLGRYDQKFFGVVWGHRYGKLLQ